MGSPVIFPPSGGTPVVMPSIAGSPVVGAGAALDPTLVGWWKLNEPSGSVAIDSSIDPVNGVWQGTPSRVTDARFGTVAQFTGSNAVLTPSDDMSLPTGVQVRTMMGWANIANASTRYALFGYGNAGGGTAFNIETNVTSSGQLYFVGYGADLQTSATVADGTWHHLAATYDGTTLTLYVDGTAVASRAATFTTEGNVMSIGQQSYNDGSSGAPNYWNAAALIRDVRLYSRTLSQAEIAAIVAGS
jgi:hypothetical protein